MIKSVELILEPNFSDKLAGMSEECPIWIIYSSANELASQKLRSRSSSCDVTVIIPWEKESPEELLARAVFGIDDHCNELSSVGGYESIHVTGTTAEPPSYLLDQLGLRFQSGRAGDFFLVKDGVE